LKYPPKKFLEELPGFWEEKPAKIPTQPWKNLRSRQIQPHPMKGLYDGTVRLPDDDRPRAGPPALDRHKDINIVLNKPLIRVSPPSRK
jgi:hypothetical protein